MPYSFRYDLLEISLKLLGAMGLMLGFYFGAENLPHLTMLCWFAAMLMAAAGSIVSSLEAQFRRREAMRIVAVQLGLSFLETGSENAQEWPLPAGLVSLKLPRRITNVIEGPVEHGLVRIHDCGVESTGEHVTHQTVITLRCPKLEAPAFSLIPVGWTGRLFPQLVSDSTAAIPGYRLISNVRTVAEDLAWRVSPWMEGTLCLEAEGDLVHFYRQDRLVEPQHLPEFLQLCQQIHQRLLLQPELESPEATEETRGRESHSC